jgi:DNA-binding NarL/FixJ family response regulator
MQLDTFNNESPSVGSISVIIVDDHPIMRDGLAHAFSATDDIQVIGTAANAAEGIQLVRAHRPQVVLMDINLPDMNGLEAAARIKAEFRQRVSVVLVTAHDDLEQIIHAMRVGASGYCSKEIEVEKLILTVRTVVGGGYMIQGQAYSERGLQEWLATQAESLGGRFVTDTTEHLIPLSPREMEILRCVTRGLSNKEIALALGISHQTVKNHMTNVLDKLGVEDRTQAAVYALKHGWVRVGDDAAE